MCAEVDKALCELVLTANYNEVSSIGRELRKRGGCPTEPLFVWGTASGPLAF
ncbi:MAG: hypothetical protein ACOZQL_30890 [Myxococcota bacterium]